MKRLCSLLAAVFMMTAAWSQEIAAPDLKINELNTSSFTHSLVLNLCTNSSVEEGLCFSEDCFQVLKLVKQFNYKNICNHPRIEKFKRYATLILETLFEQLGENMDGSDVRDVIIKEKILYPKLYTTFEGWLVKYSDYDIPEKEKSRLYTALIVSRTV